MSWFHQSCVLPVAGQGTRTTAVVTSAGLFLRASHKPPSLNILIRGLFFPCLSSPNLTTFARFVPLANDPLAVPGGVYLGARVAQALETAPSALAPLNEGVCYPLFHVEQSG